MKLAVRTEFQHRMCIARDYDECKPIPTDHTVLIAARARESRCKVCGQMKAREFLK